VLVVDGQAEFRELLQNQLIEGGYQVSLAANGEEAFNAFWVESPQAVLLDLGLPRLAGLNVLERIRRVSSLPVIVMTGEADDAGLAQAFALGANDLVRKSCSSVELLARLRARLREPRTPGGALTCLGKLEIDWARAQVFQDGERVRLSAREFRLLSVLYQNRNQVLSRAWLLEHIWRNWDIDDDRLIDAAIKRLRSKVGRDLIETVRGVGFRLSKEE